MTLSKIILKSGKERSALRYHPWIFSGAVKNIEGAVNEGDIVEVYTNQKEYIGTGHFQKNSIAVRLFSFNQSKIDTNFWKSKLLTCINYRKQLGFFNHHRLNVFRLVHGEADAMPGLIMDWYNGIVVIQAHSVGMYSLVQLFTEILKDIFSNFLIAVYNKSSQTLPFKANLTSEDTFLFGNINEMVINEYDKKFIVDFINGQKTGFFIDQRENRLLFEKFCSNKTVLNAFSYTGGFSVAASKGGATTIHSIDSSQNAITLCNRNIELNNNFKSVHQSYNNDVFTFLKDTSSMYDVISIDPPAFAKHNDALEQGLKGYRNLNRLAISRLNRNGILFTYSCSQVVSMQDFRKAVFKAAADVKRQAKILYRLSQPPDHPVSIFHPEGEYLKGLVLFIE